MTEFKVGDQVLIRAHQTSDATQNVINKFCALYEGPYEVKTKFGRATYELVDCLDPRKTRGRFNIRQLKRYNSASRT